MSHPIISGKRVTPTEEQQMPSPQGRRVLYTASCLLCLEWGWGVRGTQWMTKVLGGGIPEGGQKDYRALSGHSKYFSISFQWKAL